LKKLLFCFLFAGMLASANPVTATYVGPSDGTNNGSYYVGPYLLSINGGANVDALCVDPLDKSVPGTTYLANLTQVGSADLSNTYLGDAGAKQYEEAAFLFSLLEEPGADRIGIQEAVWQIMAPTDTDPGIHTSPNAAGYIGDAVTNYQSFDFARYTIVSAVPGTTQIQEFLTVSDAPEPTSFALLGVAVIGLGIWRPRKKKAC
jgi:hypothetical protein